MAGVHASDAAALGHFLDPPPAQGATGAAGLTGGDAAPLPPAGTGTRAYLEVSSASAASQVFGAEGVYTNGRHRELSSPRIGSGSREPSAERERGHTPCGIMKVGFPDSERRVSLSTQLKVTRVSAGCWAHMASSRGSTTSVGCHTLARTSFSYEMPTLRSFITRSILGFP